VSRRMAAPPTTGPCWRNFPLSREIKVTIDNDANAAALAEARSGAGRRYREIFYATVGTGIGTGIVFDGRIYHGRTGAAVEGGHNTIDFRGPRCGCGKRGYIEAFACGPAIASRARTKLMEHTAGGVTLLELNTSSGLWARKARARSCARRCSWACALTRRRKIAGWKVPSALSRVRGGFSS